MRKIFSVVLVGAIISFVSISSCSDKAPAPTDPVLENFKKVLVGKWNVVNTSIDYPVSNGVTSMAITNVTCTTELQWDYVKTITIMSDLRVTNEYYCADSRITFFEVLRQRNVVTNSTFLVIEKDDSGNMVKIYEVYESTSPTTFIFSSRIFDSSYFYPMKVGSIPSPPTRYGDPVRYAIGIVKQ